MLNKREIIKRGIDASSGFGTYQSEAEAVNPTIWNERLREFQEQNLVLTPQAETFDFREKGTDYKVTIDEAPSAASALTETDDVPISSFSTRNVTFDPSEYGAAYQLSRNEAVRAFFNVAERMVRKLGYAMALKKDSLANSTITSHTGIESFTANSVSTLSDLASTDGMDVDVINKGLTKIENNYYMPDSLFISTKQKEQLFDSSNLNEAHKFGSREVIERGMVTEVYGVKVFVSHSISTTTAGSITYDSGLLMGKTMTGEKALGYAIKRDPVIEREYHALGRYWDVVGHEEYDFKVLHPGAICELKTYSGTS